MENDYLIPPSQLADFNRRTFFGIILIAGIATLITVIVGNLLNQFVVAPALCGSAGAAVCSNSTSVSFHIASLVAAVASVALLVNLSVYRPLLVVIALMVGTWAMYNLPFPLIQLVWFWQLGVIFLVNALSLLTFTWILRVYNLAPSIVLTLIVSVAMIVATVI